MASGLDEMIRRAVKCVICGTPMTTGCDCWVKCSKCGCSFERGKECHRCADPGWPLHVTHAS